MNEDMVKALAATCWQQLEDFSAYVDPKDTDPRNTRHRLCVEVYKLLQGVESPDCTALKVWMSLRGIAQPPGDSDMLAEAARDSALKGSPYGQFVLGFMHGFLGTFFWGDCQWGQRDKAEAIRLMEMAQACEPLRTTASFWLGCIHELGRDFGQARKAYAECPEHALAIWNLANLLSDTKEIKRLKTNALKVGYEKMRDAYYNVYGRGTCT
jgi:hypothetical protein